MATISATSISHFLSESFTDGEDGASSPGSPEIPFQSSGHGNEVHNGCRSGSSPHTLDLGTSSLHSSRKRPNSTPQSRQRQELPPSQLIGPHTDDSSSEEEEDNTLARKRPKKSTLGEKSLQMKTFDDMKEVLSLLCKKVDKNNRVLKDIQARQDSR